jgi:hypothetical protein
VCPYSNATRGNIDVALTVNGHDIGCPARQQWRYSSPGW